MRALAQPVARRWAAASLQRRVATVPRPGVVARRPRDSTAGHAAFDAAPARRVVVVQASPSSPSHAPLHDFCLLLPVGTIQLVAGLAAAAFLGARATGAAVAALGATCLLSAVASLAAWRRGAASTPFTLTGAAASGAAAAWMWPRAVSTSARVGAGAIGVVAAALALNVVLGGNAPRRGSKYA